VDKDYWLTALNVSRDAAMAKRSACRLDTNINNSNLLDISVLDNHVEHLIKQETVYLSLTAEDRPQVNLETTITGRLVIFVGNRWSVRLALTRRMPNKL
jgi:hypothetical protein